MSVTPQEFREFINLPPGDAVLARHVNEILEATVKHVASRVSVGVTGSDVEVKARTRGRALIVPMSGADEVVSVYGPDGTEVPLSAFEDLDADAGVLTLAGPGARGTYRVILRFANAEADVNLAVKMIAKHLWTIHRGSQGGARASADAQGDLLQGFAIPRRAQELMAPYERHGGFA